MVHRSVLAQVLEGEKMGEEEGEGEGGKKRHQNGVVF